MAIVKMEESKLRTRQGNNVAMINTSPTPDGLTNLVTQDSTIENFSTVPANLDDNTGVHFYPHINKFKVVELAVSSLHVQYPLQITSPQWGNWRNSHPDQKDWAGGTTNVDDRILLFPTNKTFAFNYSHEYGNAWEKLSSTGMLSKVQQGLEAMRSLAMMAGASGVSTGGKMISRYTNTPVWNKSTPVKYTSNLEFEFHFGQAGIYSGEEEVVKPILRLIHLFSPLLVGNYARGPVPTAPTYLAAMLSLIGDKDRAQMGDLDTAKNDASKISTDAPVDDKGNAVAESDKDRNKRLSGMATAMGGIVNKLTQLEEMLMKKMDDSIGRALNGWRASDGWQGGSRGLCIRMGRMSLGPYVVKEVNWDFDFTQTDEFGFPYKGKITFGGLESIFVANPSQIQHHFGGNNTRS